MPRPGALGILFSTRTARGPCPGKGEQQIREYHTKGSGTKNNGVDIAQKLCDHKLNTQFLNLK